MSRSVGQVQRDSSREIIPVHPIFFQPVNLDVDDPVRLRWFGWLLTGSRFNYARAIIHPIIGP